jgi:hypothetical protein
VLAKLGETNQEAKPEAKDGETEREGDIVEKIMELSNMPNVFSIIG